MEIRATARSGPAGDAGSSGLSELAKSVKRTRETLGMSQEGFANALGVSASTLRKWEQGLRAPTGAARVLLTMVELNPASMLRTAQRTTRASAKARSN